MSLRETVGSIRERRMGSISAGFFRNRTALSETLNRLSATEDAIGEPREDRLTVVASIVSHCLAIKSSESLQLRDWKVVPWVMWTGSNAADYPWFLESLFTQISSKRPLSVIRSLTNAYVAFFDPRRESCREVATFLRSSALKGNQPFGEKWLELDRRFCIFEPDLGPRTIGQFAANSANVLDALREAGLSQLRLDEALAECSFQFAMESVAQEIQRVPNAEPTQRAIKNLIAWNRSEAGSIRYSRLIRGMAKSLLEAIADVAPTPETSDLVANYFAQTLGDPRLNRAGWFEVSTKALETELRLLVRATLDDFFRIIDATAERRMWKERKDFWLGYWRAGAMTDAWVALGPMAEKRAGGLGRTYGRLTNANIKDQSALIVRIQDLVIIEMSHNGKCRFFPRSAPNQPGCYDKVYDFDVLRDDASHEAIHNGDWRPRFAGTIYKLTRVRHPTYGAGY